MERTKRHPAIQSNPPYVGRFAPTPSGELHLGSLVAALGSYLDARAHHGQWKLRIDDLDEQRCLPATSEKIIHQLVAHGLVPDGEVISQRTREAAYAEALSKLDEGTLTYRCRCSRKELREAAQRGLAVEGIAGPVYPGTCRSLGLPEGHGTGTRFIVPHEPIAFTDRFLGTMEQHLSESVGDPILRRSDGVFAYHLAEVVDNHAMGITHVIRGADLAPLTPLHLAIHHALFPEAPPPQYGHLPIVYDDQGLKLSKTNRAPALDVRHARANLSAAAKHLGLKPPAEQSDIEEMLAQWTTQWTKKGTMRY